MAETALRSTTRWLGVATLAAAMAFALLVAGMLGPAAYVGLASAILYTATGLQLARALPGDEDDRIDYPYPLAQRGRRLTYTALAAALGLAGFTFATAFVAGLLGATGVILAGAAAILAPPLVVMIVVWTVDGISLRTGLEAPGDPLIGAAGSLGLALLIAVVGATTGFEPSFAFLAAFGGLVPCGFLLWSLHRLDRALGRVAGALG